MFHKFICIYDIFSTYHTNNALYKNEIHFLKAFSGSIHTKKIVAKRNNKTAFSGYLNEKIKD